jgi:hypothetical protein
MEGQSPGTIARQQAERVAHLRGEAAEFRQQAAKELKDAQDLRKKAQELTK